MIANNKLVKRFLSFSQYLGSTIIVSILQIAINPFLAKNLPPVDYAIIGYYSSFSVLLTPFITFFLTNFFIQRFFKVTEQDRKIIKATVIKLLVYFSFILAAISLVGLYLYQILINTDSEMPFLPYAFLTVFSIPLTGIYSLELAELRLKREAQKFAIFTIVMGLISVSLALSFVVFAKWGAIGRLLATFVANLLMFSFVFWSDRKYISQKIDKKVAKDIIKFCWPLSLAGMLGFFSSGLDKVMLERLGNLTELGYYSVGAQIAGYLSIFSNAVNATFQPDIYESYAKRNYRRLAMYVMIIVGSIAIVVGIFIIFAPLLVDLLTAGRYTYSTQYSQVLALSLVASAIYYSSSNVTMALGYTKLLLFVKIVGGGLTVLMLWYFIDKWQFMGAAYGNVCSFLIFFIVNISFIFFYRKLKKRMK